MAKLIILLDGKLLREYKVNKDRVTIGRRPASDIHIDNLAVSGEHAQILTVGNDALIEDLNSTNGTIVNKKIIKKHLLQHNDVIELGKYQLKYLQDPALTQTLKPALKMAKPAGEDRVPAPIVTDENPLPAVKKRLEAHLLPRLQPAINPEMPVENPGIAARLQFLSGDSAGQSLLLDKALTTLGAQNAQRALITKRSQGYFISHLEGEQKPLVNGESIGARSQALQHLDQIEVSGIKMEFYLD